MQGFPIYANEVWYCYGLAIYLTHPKHLNKNNFRNSVVCMPLYDLKYMDEVFTVILQKIPLACNIIELVFSTS